MQRILTLQLLVTALFLDCTETSSSHAFSVEEEVTDPYFTSTSRTYETKLGSSVSFYCQVENIGTSTLIWKKDNRIISAGDIVIRKDKRFILSGYNLTMNSVKVKDEGDYVCEVETYNEPIRQISQLTVLVPAQVEPIPQDGLYTVRAGTTITLQCRASGNPQPVITWKKKKSELPTGQKFVSGNSILIHSVKREHAGVFVCMADNGVGNQATANINLTVLHPPVIRIEKSLDSLHNRVQVKIVCQVKAEPSAQVRWYKDNMLLDPSLNKLMESKGSTHTLVVKSLAITDFGNYSCMAENNLGRNRGFIHLSGRPQQVSITSPRTSHKAEEYTITWETISLLRVTEYRILYRLHRDRDKAVPSYRNDWTNIIPTMKNRNSRLRYDGVIFKGSFTFFGLEAGSKYEVRIQARNEEGWSERGRSFMFTMPEFDMEEKLLLRDNSGGAVKAMARIVMVLWIAGLKIYL